MNQRQVLLTVVMATIVSSGCMGGGGNENNGLNIGEGGKTITVQEFEVQPQSILSGSTTQVKLGVVNTGGLNSNVTIGEGGEDTEGLDVMSNYCPDIFSIQSFDSYSSRKSSVDDTYNLEPGDELRLTWNLKNDNTGSIPLNGYRCPLKLQVPFDYGVTAYQQIEVKENTEIQGATELASKTSGGPLDINLEMIGSTSENGAPTFIDGDNMEVLVQMENSAPEESSYQGLVEFDAPELISSSQYSINATSCNMETNEEGLSKNVQINKTMRLYEDQSRVIRCGVVMTEDETSDVIEEGEMSVPSIRGQIEARADYTYIKDLGEQTIEVEYRE